MTDAPRCEPPPELRGVDGWHVLMIPSGEPELDKWHASGMWDCYGKPVAADALSVRYVGPFTPPAEVEALRAEVMRAGAECADAMAQVATLRAANAQMREALDGAYVILCAGKPPHSRRECNARRTIRTALALANEAGG